MPRLTAKQKQRKRLSQSKQAVIRKKQRIFNKWRTTLQDFDELTPALTNNSGKTRLIEENCLILLSLKAALQRLLASVECAKESRINWKSLDYQVASDLHVSVHHVRQLRLNFFADSEVCVAKTSTRGPKVGAITKNTKFTAAILLTMVDFINQQHSEKKTVTRSKIVGKILTDHQVKISRTQVSRIMRQIGKTWAPVRPKRRTLAAQHHEALRNFLITLDKLEKMKADGNSENVVYVFMDESYVHENHQSKYSYLTKDEVDNGTDWSTGKGKRLIILHAITEDGPLAERDEHGYPIDCLDWRGDTPHPKDIEGKLTCETLWVATSHTGDYHDNMCSDMFMQWVRTRLVPTFEKLYPNKKMVLVADNAPYHHRRKIGSLYSKSKKEMCELCEQYGIEYIDLPCNDSSRIELDDDEDDTILHMGEDTLRVKFSFEEQIQRKTKNRPKVATAKELKFAFVAYLAEHNPEVIECEVENYLKSRGHDILWTPPYCPDLQPIELFWAVGKNHVRFFNYEGGKMRDVVELLREGWYGTKRNQPDDGREKRPPKEPCDCRKLWKKALRLATTKFVPICHGISGPIGGLTIDPNYVPEEHTLPIDTLVLNLTNVMVCDDENEEEVSEVAVML